MKNRKVVAMLVALAVATLVSTSQCHGQGEEPVSKTRPLVVFNGVNSRVTKGALVCVSTDKEWDETWAEHVGIGVEHKLEKQLEVDFSRVMVVAVFLGETDNCRGITVNDITETPERITIRVTAPGSQLLLRQGEEPPPPVRPFTFIVLPRSAKEIVLEQGVFTDKRAPSSWKFRARLPAAANRGSE